MQDYVEEVYIYNNDKVIGTVKLYNKPSKVYRFYNMEGYKIKKG